MLRIVCYNGRLVSGTVISLTTAKFKPLIFSIPAFLLSYTANKFILMVLYNFCLSPAQFCYIIVYMRKIENREQISEGYEPRTISSGAKNLVSRSCISAATCQTGQRQQRLSLSMSLMLRPTIIRPVCLGIKHHIFISVRQLRIC
jgi:hypothetical protein